MHTQTDGHASRTGAVTDARLAPAAVAPCYQCGKCSAGCPMAAEMRLAPHDIMRMVGRGRLQELARDESAWLCLTCETCTARCPNGCDPAAVIDAVREYSLHADPEAAPRRLRAFHRAFLLQIKSTGRLYELGLVVQYKLRSGSLIKDAASTPGLLARGKLHATARPIDGIDEIRRIFQACAAEAQR